MSGILGGHVERGGTTCFPSRLASSIKQHLLVVSDPCDSTSVAAEWALVEGTNDRWWQEEVMSEGQVEPLPKTVLLALPHPALAPETL